MNISKIQILRAVAALSVVFLHVLHDAVGMAPPNFFPLLLSLPLGAGVDLFFVISGFVMIFSSQDLFNKKGTSLEFIGKRCIRIVPAYWAATVLLVGVAIIYPSGLNSGNFKFIDFLKSLFFIPYINGDHSIQPVLKLGWTLNYEMFFYACLSMVLVFNLTKAIQILTVAFCCLILIGQIMNGANFTLLKFWSDPIVFEFIMGAWLGLAYIRGLRISRRWQISMTFFALFLLMILSGYFECLGDFQRMVIWGLPVALLFYAVVFGQSNSSIKTRFGRWFCLIGDASYVLYLFHPFVMRFFKQLWLKLEIHFQFDVYLYMLTSLGGAVIVSIFIHVYFEKPVCRWLRGYFLKRV